MRVGVAEADAHARGFEGMAGVELISPVCPVRRRPRQLCNPVPEGRTCRNSRRVSREYRLRIQSENSKDLVRRRPHQLHNPVPEWRTCRIRC